MKPSQLTQLEALFETSVRPEVVASDALARELAGLSRAIGRQVGALINRRGRIEQVVVGDAFKLELPELGRTRASPTRLRGLRLVHTHLRGEPLTPDDLADLVVLRLDLVVAIEAKTDGAPGKVYAGHLSPTPAADGRPAWTTLEAPELAVLELD
ncbi:MAG: GTPase HflX, partial [Myxococcales bacterium]